MQAVVSGRRDPGYLETGRIALEAALCLALQGEELKERGMMQGGVLTPATAMGAVLTKRLRAANIRFDITKTGNEVPTSPLDKLKAGPAGAAARMSASTNTDKGVSASMTGNNPGLCLRNDGACSAVVVDVPDRGRRLQRCHRALYQHAQAGLTHVHPAVIIVARSCGSAAVHLRQAVSDGLEGAAALHRQAFGVHLIVARRAVHRLQQVGHQVCPVRQGVVDAAM